MRPRVGFLGVGWIGRHRMEAMLDAVEAVAVADASEAMASAALESAPGAVLVSDLAEMLALGVDGVVIATPSALHAEQATMALEAGAAVFCQKPLGRDAGEAMDVVQAARRADRLLAVDFSYRRTEAAQRLRETIASGAIGRIYAADLVFHNAYGPDKPWFYERRLSGGGCVMDLGVHLVDLALWLMDWPELELVSADLLAGGAKLESGDSVEDYAAVTLRTAAGSVVRLSCSWRLPAGQDAVIAADFYGVEGGVNLRNVGGSFYDFEAHLLRGTSRQLLASPPDAWGGRAARDWAVRLGAGERYDAGVERAVDVAEILDRIYMAAG